MISKKIFIAFAGLSFTGFASATNYSWTGSDDDLWRKAGNWSPSSDFPGNAAGDTATIADATPQANVVLDSALDNALTSLTINAATPAADMTLQVTAAPGVSFGAVALTGDASNTATLDADADVSASSVAVTALGAIEIASGVSFAVSGNVTINASANLVVTGGGSVPSDAILSIGGTLTADQSLTVVGPVRLQF